MILISTRTKRLFIQRLILKMIDIRLCHPVVYPENDSFHLEKSPFHCGSALKSPELTVASHRPVAGYDNWKRVGCQGATHGPGSRGFPDRGGKTSIGAGPPSGYLKFCKKHAFLKRRT